MNHTYSPREDNSNKCTECGYHKDSHGPNAECDSCTNKAELNIFGLGNTQALLCPECIKREKAILETEVAINDTLRDTGISALGVPSDGEDRVTQMQAINSPYQKLISESRKIDEQLHLSSDIFTAKTVAINDIREAIWKDDAITSDGKFFELVRVCKERVSHFQSVIFDLDKKKIEAYSEQKAWHIYMNQYAVHLRTEERERLRIADITYDVKVPKAITPKAVKLNKTKVSETEIREALKELYKELGAPESAVMSSANFRSMFLVSKNLTVEEGIKRLRVMLKTSLSES